MTTDTPELAGLHFGWLGHRPDARDISVFQARSEIFAWMAAAPDTYRGLEQYLTIGRDQATTNSCVSWAVAEAERLRKKFLGITDYDPSELSLYYWLREKSGLQNQDSGGFVRDGFKAANQEGVAVEDTHRWSPAQINQRPPQAAYTSGLIHQLLRYATAPASYDVRKGLLSQGFPVTFGVPIYQNASQGFSTGDWPMPAGSIAGYHAMTQWGYERDSQGRDWDLVTNSWGRNVGRDGLFRMPRAYNEQMSEDNWYPDLMEGEAPPVPPPPPPPPPPNETEEQTLQRLMDKHYGAVGQIDINFTKGRRWFLPIRLPG